MNHLAFIVFLCASVAASVWTRKLTLMAGLTGGALAVLLYASVGWVGIALMGAFFLLGTGATAWRKRTKLVLGLTQEGSGRTTGQVLANGGAAGLIASLAILFPQHSELCLLLIAAAFSSATADTVSSELGSVYGRKFYDVLSMKKGERGRDGVVSADGTLFGLLGSIVIAAVYATAAGWNQQAFFIVVAGTVGNLADSYLGATLERRGLIGNNAVNFLNTAVAIVVLFTCRWL